MTRARPGRHPGRRSDRQTPVAADDRPRSRRLFIAVPLPGTAIEHIARLVDDVRGSVPDADSVRWVRVEGLHLTARFLGRTDEALVARLKPLIDDTARDTAPFPIAIASAGAFPSATRPRVLWLGLHEGAESMARVASSLDAGLSLLGWTAEARPYRAHLTLARCDGVRAGPAVARKLTELAAALDTRFEADRLVLFESVTGRGPARYLPLHEAPMGGVVGSETAVTTGGGDTIHDAGDPPRAGRKGALGAT